MLTNLEKQLFSAASPIGVIGLGYVGLPLACLLSKKFKVVGFDIKSARIEELKIGVDRTREIDERGAMLNAQLQFTARPEDLKACRLFIVAVPTPVDDYKKPDLGPLVAASKTVAKVVQAGSVVVFESTVYPGATEDVCGKIIAEESGLKLGKDFWLGYSPERVNPGDREHTIDRIVKLVSGSNKEVTKLLAKVYGAVVTAGIHEAASIKTAEAAKVIENTQRDLNIALINELAMLFDHIGLDTQDVLEASGTKWNFLPFRPGLVGGHCIGVDPYYLTYMAEGLGLHPQLVLAGRRINDGMGDFVAKKTLNLILRSGHPIKDGVKVGILGVTFKENVPDTRNTKVVSIAQALEAAGATTYLVDPLADEKEFQEEYGRKLCQWEQLPPCDAIIMAVKHQHFMKNLPLALVRQKLNEKQIILDLKGVFSRSEAKEAGVTLWRL